MQDERIHPDEAIDRTLAALRGAVPPEGMEARIAQRLQQPERAGFRWRGVFTGSTVAAAWGRGAVSGAVFTLFVVGVVMVAQHGLHGTRGPARPAMEESASARVASAETAPGGAALENTSSREAVSVPCASRDTTRVRGVVPAAGGERSRAEGLAAVYAPSRPAPVLPLTEQERALVELARTADPKVLAALAPETQAKVDAQEEENFKKFFAPPPAPPQPADSEPATKTNESQSQL